MKLARVSLLLLAVQVALVSTVALKYFYQRATCPRVWTRAAAYDPSLIMRGRYLSLQLTVDGCSSTLPSAKNAQFPRNAGGTVTVRSPNFNVTAPDTIWFQARLGVKDNKLIAIRVPEPESTTSTQNVAASPGSPCDQMRLAVPVDFYISEHASDPTFLKKGQELWIEVTVPPKGPPRPLQLALKDNGAWKPLAFQ
ncbi:GDYXXLXY domain-containing protein [Occallatibacter savannae]|uniref:GDYXXLXY domain-containing protein n=1 Tax=Occallatibacter savannae TaxID=1002691 RepID=UPI000D690B5F|nr:GDYXXLXY domain-containing protein [Occallatibacter savannae]